MAVSSVSSTSNYYTQAAAAGPVSIATALAAIKANARTKVTISDTSDNLALNLDALRKVANNITQVTQSDPDTALQVSAPQWAQLGTLLSKFSTNYQLQVSDVPAAKAATAASSSHVASFTVLDSSANIAAQLANLQGQTKLQSIATSTPTTNITVRAEQLTTQAEALGKLSGNYGLAVTQATAEQAVGYASNLRIKSVAVLDSVAGVSAQLDGLKTLGLRLKEIRGSDSQVFAVTADQIQTDALVIGKLYKGYQLSVLGASMEQLQSLASNLKVVSVDIEDTAANLANNLALLDRLGSDLHSIHVTDTANPLTLSSDDFGAHAAQLQKILATDDYSLSITNATVDEAQTLLDNTRVGSITVADSSAAIAARLDALQLNTKVTDIRQTGKPTALAVNWGQITADADTLAKIRGNYNLQVSGVDAAHALSVAQGNARITSLSVSDSGSAITANLASLAALGKRLSRIDQSDNTSALNLSVSQWSNNMGTLSKIASGYSLALSGVSAAKAQTLANDNRVASVSVSDSAASIAAQLDSLHSLGTQLTTITQTDAGTALSISANQWSTRASTLAKLGTDYTLSVRGATAAQVSTLVGDTKVTAIEVADSSDHIAAQLDTLQDIASADTAPTLSVRQTGKATPMAITATQLARDAQALNLIAGNYSLAVSGVSAANATQIGSNGQVSSMTVTDSAANLSTELGHLAALGAKVSRIEQTDAGTALQLTAAAWATYSGVLNKVDGGVRADISAVKASSAQALLGDGRVQSVAVLDTAAQLSGNLDLLQGLGPLLTSLEQSDTGTAIAVSMGQLTSAASTLAKVTGDYALAVNGASAQQAQDLLDAGDSHVQSIAVTDTSANIAANLDALQANTKLSRITQTGPTVPLGLNVAQLSSDADALAKIQGSYSLAIGNAQASDVASLAANTKVVSMAVTDSAANIVATLGALKAAGNKVGSIQLNDSNTPATLSLSQAQWTVNQPVLAKIASNYNVAVGGVGAALAAAVASDTRVASLMVNDTTASINANLAALQGLGPQLLSITPSETGTPPAMSLTAAQRSAYADALGKITDGRYTLRVTAASVDDAQDMAQDSQVSRISVLDTSANIASHLSELNANGKLGTITQAGTPDTLSISADLYAASTATLAKFSQGYSLQLSDASAATAASLQANAHVTGFTVADTSSHVNSALATLAGLDKLGQITLTQDDGPISVTQNQLDTWADTLALINGGKHLHVTDVTMANFDAIAQTADVSAISLSASSQEVSSHFDSLVTQADTLARIDLTDASTPIALTHDQYQQGAGVLAQVQGDYLLALVDVKAQNATNLAAQAHVGTVSVADTSANISAHFDELMALGSQLDVIEPTDTDPIVLTQAQIDAAGADGMQKIMGSYEVLVA